MVSYLQVHEWMAQSNLVIQTVILLLIVFSIVLQRKKMYVWHGNTMLLAVIVNGLLLVMHMGPTFVLVAEEGLGAPSAVSFFGVAHGILGAIALGLGIWLTVTWAHLESETKYCVRKKSLMRRILALWVISIGLGYVYYYIHLVWF
jgi:uncharacterized membrane protein YozB (DUF420 family)